VSCVHYIASFSGLSSFIFPSVFSSVYLQTSSPNLFNVDLAEGRWFSLDTPGFSINKTDRHDIAEIL
jgi:hypothetical protein